MENQISLALIHSLPPDIERYNDFAAAAIFRCVRHLSPGWTQTSVSHKLIKVTEFNPHAQDFNYKME